MPRYYFSLANHRPFTDVDGLELPDVEAARAEAIGFASDLMRLEPGRRDWSDWVVRVTDESQKTVFNLRFSDRRLGSSSERCFIAPVCRVSRQTNEAVSLKMKNGLMWR